MTVEDDDDSPATGAVTITGPATEGETLTADTSGIADADGLDNARYVYQWTRTPSGGGDADIAGATSQTYVPVFADAGATLKVKVTVTDDEGHEATFTSASTSAVAALPRPSVTVTSGGDVTEGNAAAFTLTRTGDTAATLDVAWETTASGDFGAATGAGTATFRANDSTVQVSVSTTDDGVHETHGSVTLSLTADTGADPAWLSGDPATATVAVRDDDDSPATGAVTVTGTATEGETLAADMSGIDDGDGLDNAAWVHQWVRTPAAGSDADISGATSQTYVPVFTDVGATLKVRVTVTDDEGHEATFTSAPTSAVAALPRPGVTVVSGGDVTEGNAAAFTLTRTGDTAAMLDVAWTVTAAGDFGAATGAGTVTFPANSATVQVSVATTDDGIHETHGSVTLSLTADTSADPAWLPGDPATATVAVKDDDNAAPTGAPSIDDTTPVVGQTLTADPSGIDDPDGLTGASWAWRWLRVAPGGTGTEVGTGVSYTVVAGDVGATLKTEASFTDDGGTEETVESAVTAAVEAAPRPRVAVAPVASPVEEGEAARFTLTRTGVMADALTVRYGVSESGDMVAPGDEGAKSVAFGDGVAGVTVTVPTVEDAVHEADSAVTLTLTADAAWDLGTASGQVTVEDDDDSPATGAVTITGTATEGETLTADTSGIADADGLDNARYVYQWSRTPSGGGDADIADATDATYVPVFADVGATLKVKVTVTDDEGHEATFTSAPTSAVAALPRPSVTVTSGGDVTEGSAAAFTLTRTGNTAATLDVAWTVTASGDFGAATGAGTVTFPADSATVQVSVATTDDGIHETHGSVTLSLTAGTGADPAWLPGDPATATVAVKDDDNAAPTGAPSIDDTTPVVGQTLTADPSGIDDPDGLTGASWAWRWLRVAPGGAETEVGTGVSYTVVAGDVGATLKAEASFTDDGGTEETVESAVTAAVEAAPRPRVAVAPVASPVEEGEAARFTLTRTGVMADVLTVRYGVSESGDMVAPGDEGAKSVAFGDGVAGVTVTVPTVEDAVHEADSAVTLTLTADAALGPGDRQRAGDGRGRRRLACDRSGDDHGPGDGGRDPDRGHVGHCRRGRSGQRAVRLPVDPDAVGRRRRGHRGCDLADLRAGLRGRGRDAEGQGDGHRRRGSRGDVHKRVDLGGRGAAATLGDGDLGWRRDGGQRCGVHADAHGGYGGDAGRGLDSDGCR